MEAEQTTQGCLWDCNRREGGREKARRMRSKVKTKAEFDGK